MADIGEILNRLRMRQDVAAPDQSPQRRILQNLTTPSFGPTSNEALTRYSSIIQGTPKRSNVVGGTDIVMGPDSIEYRRWLPRYGAAYAITVPGAPVSEYPRDTVDDPITRRHEMVHQIQAGIWGNNPNKAALDAAGIPPYKHEAYTSGYSPPIETPAYRLEGDTGQIVDQAKWAHAYKGILRDRGGDPSKIDKILDPDVLALMNKMFPQ